MAYIPIAHGMQEIARSGGSRPPTKTENKILAVVTVVLLVLLTLSAVMLVRSYQARAAQAAQMKQQWDSGIGHPEASPVHPDGQKVTVPAVMDHVNPAWDACSKYCLQTELTAYPMVYSRATLPFRDGCAVITQKSPVGTLMATATRGATPLAVEVPAGSSQIKVCGQLGDNDRLVLWRSAA